MDATQAVKIARAELELRARDQKRRLGERYDWYGGVCSCGVPLGECEEHPRARHDQRPPEGDWRHWLLRGGRGSGKTRTAAEFVRHRVEAGQARHVALVGDTVKDVRTIMIEGPSGLLAISPPWFTPVYEPSKAQVTWPNGAVATIYSAEKPEQLRGPQFHLVWPDELAKWSHNQQETWDQIQFALRMKVEPRPQAVITTTPQPTETFKSILRDPRTVWTKARTADNARHLDPDFLRYIHQKYGNTRLGLQELDAELLEDTPGALWKSILIDPYRLEKVPWGVNLIRVVVGVDPGAGSSDPESGAETGIVIAGRGDDGHGYVLGDWSLKGSPQGWGKKVLEAYQAYQADRVAAEVNNGGDMVEANLRAIQADPGVHPSGASIAFKKLWASRGKVTRAEPVVSLYEQGRIHHVGPREVYANLESQMTTWVPSQRSPDRMDALVWTLYELLIEEGSEGQPEAGGYRQAVGQSSLGGLSFGGGRSVGFGQQGMRGAF
jgi:phage terminase large subunit-like protein